MLWLMLLTLILATCRGGAPKKNQPSSRSFPSAEIPQILEEPQERMDWLVEHFWDRFLDPAVSEVSDSLHLNGITTDEVEKQVGMFTTLLQQAQPSARSRAMEKVFSLSEAYSMIRMTGSGQNPIMQTEIKPGNRGRTSWITTKNTASVITGTVFHPMNGKRTSAC